MPQEANRGLQPLDILKQGLLNHLKKLSLFTYILFSLPKHLQSSQSSEVTNGLSNDLSSLKDSPQAYAWQFLEG